MIAELGLRIRSDGTREAVSDLDRLRTAATRTERSVAGMSTGIHRSTNRLAQATGAHRNLGLAAQNASYQIGDFAVQVAAGTSATRALSMQLPQLLGGFGLFGAAAGAAVAVGGALVPMFLNMRDNAVDAEDAVERLAEAIDAYDEAAKRANASSEELVEWYGDLSEVGQRLSQFIADMRLGDAVEASREAVKSIRGEFSDLFSAIEELNRARSELNSINPEGQDYAGSPFRLAADAVAAARIQVGSLTEELELSSREAQALNEQLTAFASAEGPREAAIAADQLLQYMTGVYGTVQNIPDALQPLATKLAEAAERTTALSADMDEAAGSAGTLSSVDLASPIAAGANEAARLAQNLFSAASAKAAFADQAQRTAVPEAQLGFGVSGVGDPSVGSANLGFGSNPGGDTRRNVIDLTSRFQPPSIAGGGSGGGGGGGGVSEAQRQHNERLKEAERIIADTRTELEQYNAELADLAELNEMGYFADAPEAYARAVRQLNEEFASSQHEQLRQGIENISDSIADAIVNGENLGESFRQILRQMAADILSSGIRDLLTNMLTPDTPGGGGGILGAIVSAIGGGVRQNANGNAFLHGEVTHFANGGIVDKPTLFPMASGTGLMGEAGPEAVMPLKRGSDGKLGVQAQQSATRVEIVPSPYFDVRVDDRARGVAAPMVGSAARMQHRSLGSRSRNIQMRGTN